MSAFVLHLDLVVYVDACVCAYVLRHMYLFPYIYNAYGDGCAMVVFLECAVFTQEVSIQLGTVAPELISGIDLLQGALVYLVWLMVSKAIFG